MGGVLWFFGKVTARTTMESWRTTRKRGETKGSGTNGTAEYCHYWVVPGATKKEIAKVLKNLGASSKVDLLNRAKVDKLKANFALGELHRTPPALRKLEKLLIGIGIFGAVGEGGNVALGIAAPDEHQRAAFEAFLGRYRQALGVATAYGRPPNAELIDLLIMDFDRWLAAIGFEKRGALTKILREQANRIENEHR